MRSKPPRWFVSASPRAQRAALTRRRSSATPLRLQHHVPPRWSLSRCAVGLHAWLALLLLALSLPLAAGETADEGIELIVGGRLVHTFRAPLGDISAAERAASARQHILAALNAGGEGWTSVRPTPEGQLVELDGAPVFTVVAGDIDPVTGDSPATVANAASRSLQKVWAEHRARQQGGVDLLAWLRVLGALAVLLGALAAMSYLGRRGQRLIAARLARRVRRSLPAGVGSHLVDLLVTGSARLALVLMWALALAAVVAFIAYASQQFVLTRPIGEHLVDSLRATLFEALHAIGAALPGLFVALAIFLLARLATQVLRALFDRIENGSLAIAALDGHTAPATRHLLTVAVWLFALAMAYPYLPGSQTEAFKGLSVLLGVMVSIGASGLVGQIASGLILVYTRALLVGEYVRVQDHEGTVTQLGLCVTRLRTGSGEEVMLPNSLVISQVTRNLSRNVGDGGVLVEAEVTIGYDTPWRQVHALLQEAAATLPALRRQPPPQVVQTALSDFYVGYRLMAQADLRGQTRQRVLSDLHAAIQDRFNLHGVQIMSPHYRDDPALPKTVPPGQWNPPPASAG